MLRNLILLASFLLLVSCRTEPTILHRPQTALFITNQSGALSASSASHRTPTLTQKQSKTYTDTPQKNAIRIAVPFASQAPFGDWNDPRQQEGCEEMSAIMVHHYLQGTALSSTQALTELFEFHTWQKKNGYPLDIGIADLAVNIEQRYGYRTRIESTVQRESIVHYLNLGYPIIVPVAGKKLQNPYFTDGGPWYHMLVITGYDDTHFYTNDPGTKRGESYRYKHDILLDAIHDWTGKKEHIAQGKRRMLIVYR